jgi:hypothetical protein
MKNVYEHMSDSEIWDGWCGNASPKSDEGHFASIDEVRDYIADRMRDWANESLDDDRVISEMTSEEIESVVNGVWDYFQDNK